MKPEIAIFNSLDILRGEISIEDYKLYLLPSLSLKYVESHPESFDIPDQAYLSEIIKDETNILERLKEAFSFVEGSIEWLEGVYQAFDFSQVHEATLFQVLMSVNSLRIADDEWAKVIDSLLYNLSLQGRYRGEFYTPEGVKKLGIRLLYPQSGSFYDGAAGIGGCEVEADEFTRKNSQELSLYGQEINRVTWALGKLNLLMHGRYDAKFAFGDTLQNPAFTEDGRVKKFDYVMMNFPFSMKLPKNSPIDNDPYKRFIYGTPSRNNADMAFVLHALASLENNGRAVLVVTNGTLFRRGTEGKIRSNLISADLVEAVIALPSNLFGYTSIPTNLLILNKNKPEGRKGKVLFVDAVDEYIEERRIRRLSESNIEKIESIYRHGTIIKRFSKFVSNTDIQEGNLLCSRYLQEDEINIEPFGTVKFKRNAFNHLPCKKVPLHGFADIYRGMNISSRSVEEGEGEYRIIKLSDVQDGKISMPDLTKCKLKRNTKIQSYLVEAGDVLVSNRGTTIKIAVVPEHEGKVLLSHNFLGIRLGNLADPYFLKAYLESPVGRFQLTSNQAGTNVVSINPKDLKGIEVPVPEMSVQKNISLGFDNVRKQYEEAIKKVEEEKREKTLALYEQMGIKDAFEIIEQ